MEEENTLKQVSAEKGDWCSGPVLGNMLRFAFPLILAGLLQLLFNAADLVVVGRFCGSSAMAAVGATGYLTGLFINFFWGITVGTGVAASHAIGAQNTREQKAIVDDSMILGLSSGLLLTVLGIVFSKPLLQKLGTPEDILPMSVTYIRLYFLSTPFIMLYDFGTSLLGAAGDSKNPLRYLSLAGGLNVVLNVVFVTVFRMGVAGVAIASTLTQALATLLVLRNLMRRQGGIRLELKQIRVNWPLMGKILRIGLPAGFQNVMFSVSNLVIQSSVNSFGSAAVSGVSAANSLESFIWVSMNAFAQAAQNFTGRNLGAGKPERLRRITVTSVLSELVIAAFLGGVVCLFGRALLGIYITDSAEAVAFGMIHLLYFALPYFLCGINDVLCAVIRGMGYSLLPLLVSVVGIIGTRLTWVYTYFADAAHHTMEKLLVCYPLSWAVASLMSLVGLLILARRRLSERTVR